MKKFIPLLLTIAIIGFLNSYNIDDKVFVDISKQKESKPIKNREISEKRDLGCSISSFMMFGSLKVNNNQLLDIVMLNEKQQNSQEDPPVKNGNHWKNGN